MEVTKTIFKRLFRVYAHIYHSHFKQVWIGSKIDVDVACRRGSMSVLLRLTRW